MKDNWKEIRLIDLASFRRGSFPQPYGLDKWYDDLNGIPFIQVFDVADNMRLKSETKRKISKLGSQMSVFIPKGTLILTIQGSIGRVAITDYDAYMDRTLLVFQKFYEEVDLKFILYVIKELFKEAKENANGSTIKTITKEELSEYQISLPPLPQQKKIAKILSTCDEVIEKTEAAIAKYQAIKQGMMHDLFTRGIDLSTGQLRPKQEDAPELYKESELGWIPKEWEVKRIDEVGEVVTGSTPSTQNNKYYDGNYMFISPADVSESKYIIDSIKKVSELGLSVSREIPPKSICVVCIGSTIGKIGITKDLCTTNQQINSIIPFDVEKSDFIFYVSKLFLIKQLMMEAGLQAVPIVNKTSFEKLKIPFVKRKDEATIIAERLNSIESKINSEQTTLKKYEKIKAGLMQDLLSGKVEVSADK